MWATALLNLVGGTRAAIFLGVSLLLAIIVFFQGVKLDRQEEDHAAYVEKVIEATSKARDAANVAMIKSKEALVEYHEKSRSADEAYSAGRQSAINAQSVLADDLRADRVRLQQQWRGCESNRVREGQPVAGTSEGSDDYAELRIASASRAIRAADDADTQVTWLQSELLATRDLYSKCMVPKEVK